MRFRSGKCVSALCALVLLMAFQIKTAAAHGGLAMDVDFCKLRVGRYLMHFVGYQPDSPSAMKEFCEDIPQTGATIIVLDYIDEALRDMPTEVRVIRDTGDESNLDAVSVFHLPAKVYPSGSLSLEHKFSESGRYVGLVTVHGPEKFVSRFPFSVGKPGFNWLQVVGAVAAVAAAMGLYWFAQRQRTRQTGSGAV
jgi:hypothetical protein